MTADIINNRLIKDLKEKYYHLITQGTFQSFSHLIEELSTTIEMVLNAHYVDIYLFNDFTNRFEKSTKISKENEEIVDSISLDEFKSLLKYENNTDYPLGNQLFKQSNNRDAYIIPMESRKENFGFILIMMSKTEADKYNPTLNEIVYETQQILNKMELLYQKIEQGQKHQILLDLTSSFRITMNVESILEETIRCLRDVYPNLQYYFLLEEASTCSSVPIKLIDYYKECEASTQAYLNGQIQYSNFENDKLLYFPLKGKQGVYGVLEVILSSAEKGTIHSEDIDFITKVANASGRGLENVKLYTQSTRLIDDLQFINQSSQQLNTNMSLSDTHSYMSNLILSSFKAQEVGFIFYQSENNKFRILDESTNFFSSDKGKEFVDHLNNYGEQLDEGLFIGDFGTKNASIDIPYQSVMMVPMLHQKEIIGSVIVLREQEYFFSFETFKLLKSLVQHSTLTIVNALLKEELEQLVRTDYLTKLYSRKFLDETMNSHIINGSTGSFILIDIDNFKMINDQYGHNVGDQIILQVANIIKDNIRSQDIAARWGGEELAIYLPNTPIHLCLQVAERLVETVAEQTQPKVTISCGISYWDDNLPDQTSDIFLRADRALYIAKEKGKNQVVRHDEVFN